MILVEPGAASLVANSALDYLTLYRFEHAGQSGVLRTCAVMKMRGSPIPVREYIIQACTCDLGLNLATLNEAKCKIDRVYRTLIESLHSFPL